MIGKVSTNDRLSWKDWWQASQLEKLVIISPHLDDGVFSAYGLLTHKLLPNPILATVFTKAPGDAVSPWCVVTGFRNNQEEFDTRRREDVAATSALGIRAIHWDQQVQDWSPEAASRQCDELLKDVEGPASSTLVMLPAGAGNTIRLTTKLLRRLLRIPLGAPPHGEHVAATALLRRPLEERGFRVGYYAEVPYIWADSVERVMVQLQTSTGSKLLLISMKPDVDGKHYAASFYRSQLHHILGEREYFQKKVLSHPELYFLPQLN